MVSIDDKEIAGLCARLLAHIQVNDAALSDDTLVQGFQRTPACRRNLGFRSGIDDGVLRHNDVARDLARGLHRSRKRPLARQSWNLDLAVRNEKVSNLD